MASRLTQKLVVGHALRGLRDSQKLNRKNTAPTTTTFHTRLARLPPRHRIDPAVLRQWAAQMSRDRAPVAVDMAIRCAAPPMLIATPGAGTLLVAALEHGSGLVRATGSGPAQSSNQIPAVRTVWWAT